MAGFNDILGHEQEIAHLRRAIETGQVSHAFSAEKKEQASIGWPRRLQRRCSVREKGNIPVVRAIPAVRHLAATTRTLFMSGMRSLRVSVLRIFANSSRETFRFARTTENTRFISFRTRKK